MSRSIHSSEIGAEQGEIQEQTDNDARSEVPSGMSLWEVRDPNHVSALVGTVLLIFGPLPIKALSSFLGISGIPAVLLSLRPLFFVPNSGADSIRVFHDKH